MRKYMCISSSNYTLKILIKKEMLNIECLSEN